MTSLDYLSELSIIYHNSESVINIIVIDIITVIIFVITIMIILSIDKVIHLTLGNPTVV